MPPNPHDALVKATFSQPEHAAGILRHALPPALVARLAFPTLALRPGSYVDEALRERHSDLLFTVETLGGAPVLVYLLFEHQSSVDALMAYRLLRYMVRIGTSTSAPTPRRSGCRRSCRWCSTTARRAGRPRRRSRT